MKKLRSLDAIAPAALSVVTAGDDPAAVTPDAADTTSTVSNVLKTRHDTVKNSIGNVH